MPNLELQLGNVRPPLGTRPCAQRSEHEAVARVVDELRAGGSGSKGQHKDSREATLKRGCEWSAEGETNTSVEMCPGIRAAVQPSPVPASRQGRVAVRASSCPKCRSPCRARHTSSPSTQGVAASSEQGRSQPMLHGAAASSTHGVAASDAPGGSLFYPGLQPLAHGAPVSRRTESSRWSHASAGLGERSRTAVRRAAAPRAAAPRRARARAGKLARCGGGAASSSCTQSQSSATCASWP